MAGQRGPVTSPSVAKQVRDPVGTSPTRDNARITTLRKIFGCGAPYVSRGQLRFPAARPDVVAQSVKLNPDASIETQ